MLRAAGVSRKEYVEHWFVPSGKPHGGAWGGDSCGCSDDRCIGHHHDDSDDCGCFPVCLAEVLAAREPLTDDRVPCPWDHDPEEAADRAAQADEDVRAAGGEDRR